MSKFDSNERDKWDEYDEWDECDGSEEGELWKGFNRALDEGYEFYEKEEWEKCLAVWEPLWGRLKANVAGAEMKMELFEVDEATEFQYEFEEWLTALLNVYYSRRDFENIMQLSKEVKAVFAWEKDYPNEWNEAIGNILLVTGKEEESDAWYEGWLQREPDNSACVDAYVLHFASRGQEEKAEALLDKSLNGVSCDDENQILFFRACSFYKLIGDLEKAEYYKKKTDEFMESFMTNPTTYCDVEDTPLFFGDENGFGGFDSERQEPVVKPQKIYPNDPCPCGSGKKYKKCCGK